MKKVKKPKDSHSGGGNSPAETGVENTRIIDELKNSCLNYGTSAVIVSALLATLLILPQTMTAENDAAEARAKKLSELKFGMFIHFNCKNILLNSIPPPNSK